MWDILDMYKDAAIKTRERDFENEALALSRQGRMFEEIFKIRHKAHQYYRRAFDLALILPPRNLNKVDWFLESKQALDRFQQDILKEEEEKAKKEKGPILEKLAPVLKEIKAADEKSMYNLLAHIYTKHPPKVQHDYVEKDVNSENIKRTIMKAIRNYHPDKQMLFGMEWRVLCEEITKCLTVRYETIKGSE
jgi:dTDP-4-amino-4,6-dideoxygalactose transaminase